MTRNPLKSILVATALVAMLAITAPGCDDDDSPSEEAAERRMEEETREAGDAAGDALEETGDALKAAGERTGQALERGQQKTGEALEDLGERMQRDADPPPTTRPTGND